MSEDGSKVMTYKKLDDEIDQALVQKRRIFLSGVVDMDTANDVIRKLWYLEAKEPGKPVLFIINSPGGSVDAGFAIWDQLKMVSSPITTLVTGLAASMGSVLSLCAEGGRRFATKNARIMIHQPHVQGVIRGQATDLEIQAKEIIKTRNALVTLYMHATGKPREVIEKALDRDNWYTPEEAMDFGLLDGIITSFHELKEFS